MAKIRTKLTKLELMVIKALYAAGLRFHLHYKSFLAPQIIVLATHGVAIFTHGCFLSSSTQLQDFEDSCNPH